MAALGIAQASGLALHSFAQNLKQYMRNSENPTGTNIINNLTALKFFQPDLFINCSSWEGIAPTINGSADLRLTAIALAIARTGNRAFHLVEGDMTS